MNLLEILLIRDTAADALLTREAFGDAEVSHRLHARNGLEALAFRRGAG